MAKDEEAKKKYSCWSWITCFLCIGWIGIAVLIGIGTIFGNSWTSPSIDEVIEPTWSKWSACSNDEQTRSRTLDDGSCILNCLTETESCQPPAWTSWTPCSNQCGQGYQLRKWQCHSDQGLHCNQSMEITEKQDCQSEDLCHVECVQSLMGDGFCDDLFNIAKCNFDNGDCCLENVDTSFCTQCNCYQIPSIDNVICAFTDFVANGYCEDFANVRECAFDGGDCCGDQDYSYCAQCQCKYDEYEVLKSKSISNKCALFAHAIGDGFCHDETNTEECDFDGGDCCHRITLINACKDCQCLQPNKSYSISYKKAQCPSSMQGLLKNGKCDQASNIAKCGYDAGECCGLEAGTQCRDPRQIQNGRGSSGSGLEQCEYWYLQGNGFCDDIANTKACNWDDGDCCGQKVTKGLCEECSCKSGSSEIGRNATSNAICSRDSMYNGVCDGVNNIHTCMYDGFDCCLTASGALSSDSCPALQTCLLDKLEDGLCQAENNRTECWHDLGVCHHQNKADEVIECSTFLYSDSICDLLNYHPSCDFDGGDCKASNNEDLVVVGTGYNKKPLSDFKGYLPDGTTFSQLPLNCK